MQSVMRRVFTSADGKKLLRYLLFDLNFFSICDTPEKQALRNWAAKLLNELGTVHGVEISAEIMEKNQEK
jgi:hypothetical protein